MNIIQTGISGLIVIEPDVYRDNRGWFSETYSVKKMEGVGIFNKFVQDNQSYSAQKGTLRGLHFQDNPMAQAKLIRCISGAITDVVVDLRKGSDTYKQWFSIELSSENFKQLYIPKGFAHGFVTLTDDVEIQYKVDSLYSKENDRSMRFDDPEIGIQWNVENPILSQKDLDAPLLKDSDINFSIKVLVTGVNGQLGYDVVKQLNKLGIEVKGVDIDDFDLSQSAQVQEYILGYMPDVVVHCAAYTQVDKAEDEKDTCFRVNTDGTKNIIEACKNIDAKLIFISTDYVFEGTGEKPFEPGDPKKPLSIYGKSKDEAEKLIIDILEKHFIIRTSWVFGKNGNNFIKTMLNLSENRNEINVVDDQIGSPTYTVDLANLICDMIQTKKYGVYHASNDGFCSWYEFACEIFKQASKNVKVNGIKTSEYPTKATRPANSRLSNEKLGKNGFSKLPAWQDALKRYLEEIQL